MCRKHSKAATCSIILKSKSADCHFFPTYWSILIVTFDNGSLDLDIASLMEVFFVLLLSGKGTVARLKNCQIVCQCVRACVRACLSCPAYQMVMRIGSDIASDVTIELPTAWVSSIDIGY